jgi:hypothetical protein
LTEKKDVYETAKSEMRLSERILAELPGFRGYKEKELRRESDRLIRNHLYLRLSKAKTDLREIFQTIASRRMFDSMSTMDKVVAKMDRVVEKVNHASYGYSGFFDVVKIKEKNLDRMIEFDNKLVDDVEKIAEEIKNFKSEVLAQKFDNSRNNIQTLDETLDTFEEAFDKREEVILGAT